MAPGLSIGGLHFVWSAEPVVGITAAVLALIGFYRFFPLGRNRMFTASPNPGLGIVRLSLLFAAVWFWWVFHTTVDVNIKGAYVWLYVALATACLVWGSFWRPILSLYHPADVVERGNLAGALVLAGFVLGTAFAFGGAISGDDVSCAGARLATPKCQEIAQAAGPGFAPGTVGSGGWHIVLVFFLLAYGELRANVTLVDRIGGRLASQARLDRDASAGFLLGCVALASGLVAGRAALGDFYGWHDAMTDYWRRLWPMLFIPLVAIAVGAATSRSNARALARVLTGSALVAAAALWYVLT